MRLGLGLSLPGRSGKAPLVQPSAYPNGLLGWINPDYETYSDASAVPQMINQKDGSLWGSQSVSSNQPTFRVAGINGKRAVQYQTDDFENAPAGSLSWFSGVSGYTWVALIQMTSASAGQTLGAVWSTNASSNRCGMEISSAGKWGLFGRRLDADAEVELASTVAADTNAHVIHGLADYSTGKGRIYLDGAQIAANDTLFSAGLTSATASLRARFRATILATASAFANVIVRHEALWNVPYYDTTLAPLVRSWCQDGGIAYVGV